MRIFGKVRPMRIHYTVRLHKHSRGIFSVEMCSYKYKAKGPLIDMAWMTTKDFSLFTVSWRWQK